MKIPELPGYLWLCISANIQAWYTSAIFVHYPSCDKSSFLASFTKCSELVLVVQNEYHSFNFLEIAASY